MSRLDADTMKRVYAALAELEAEYAMNPARLFRPVVQTRQGESGLEVIEATTAQETAELVGRWQGIGDALAHLHDLEDQAKRTAD